MLASAAVQVDDAFTRNAGYVKNFSKLSDAGSRVRRALSNSDLVKEIDLYFREFETLTHPKNQPYKEKPPADVAEIRNRLAHAPNMEEFETTIVPRDKTHWVDINYRTLGEEDEKEEEPDRKVMKAAFEKRMLLCAHRLGRSI